MKRTALVAGLLAVAGWVGGEARAEGEAVADMAKSLEQIAAEVQGVLARDRIHHAFDLFRIYKEFGFTYQPELAAPVDLAERLDGEPLRMYAGVKLFDAIYAATFMKRQEVADCVAAIEQVQNRLALRSHADLNNSFLQTLKRMASEPENVDVQQLIDQLATDYADELPALTSSSESADYLIDSLYGFVVEMNYVRGALVNANRALAEATINQHGTGRVQRMMLDLFEAFDRMDEEMRVGERDYAKSWVMRARFELGLAEEEGRLTDEQGQSLWHSLGFLTDAIRKSILEPLPQ